jgi:hypothetical protein
MARLGHIAALRVGRDGDGTVMPAHTAALRNDMALIDKGEVVETHSETTHRVAEVAADLAPREFTTSDVFDALNDTSRRSVRRAPTELVDAGYSPLRGDCRGTGERVQPRGNS